MDYVDRGHHAPAQMVALLELVAILGFDTPFDYVTQVPKPNVDTVGGVHGVTMRLEDAIENWH